jgi:hypothetical protein
MKQDPDLILHMIDDLHGQIEPLLRGKSQAVILLTFIRAISSMLSTADDGTRDKIIEAIPVTLRGTLELYDQKHPRANGAATPRTPPARSS